MHATSYPKCTSLLLFRITQSVFLRAFSLLALACACSSCLLAAYTIVPCRGATAVASVTTSGGKAKNARRMGQCGGRYICSLQPGRYIPNPHPFEKD